MFRPDQPKPAPVGSRAFSTPGTCVVVQHSERTVSAPGQQGLPFREYNDR